MAEAIDLALHEAALEYRGTKQPTPGERDAAGDLLEPYLPDPDLVDAVNLALELRHPLLLKGEPGCGKTRLAKAVAYELGFSYYEWHVKSTSRARDGLYTYDTVGRLRDATYLVASLKTWPPASSGAVGQYAAMMS